MKKFETFEYGKGKQATSNDSKKIRSCIKDEINRQNCETQKF